MAAAKGREVHVLEVSGRQVEITNPNKVYFPAAGYTKLDLARYYVEIGEAALRGVCDRPLVLKRYVNGIDQPAFYQKRAPEPRPDWVDTATLRFPSGRSATEVVIHNVAQLLWIVNLGCIELHPHAVRAADLEHPDELRVDLDPVPDVPWQQVCDVALTCREVLNEHGLIGFPKTSGSRGIHINVRIQAKWPFEEVRKAALALAREVERRMPGRATSAWWKEEREGVFIDYNQNAKDRTTAAAYAVRPRPDARVSTPLHWDEVAGSDPALFTLATVPQRVREKGDPGAGIEDVVGSLEGLLLLAEKQASDGLGDAPWPPHYGKAPGESKRVAPSRARKSSDEGKPVGRSRERKAADEPKLASPSRARKVRGTA